MPRAESGAAPPPIGRARHAPPPAVHQFEEHPSMSTLSSVPTSTYLNYIGGEWVAALSGQISEDRDPASGELIGRFQASGQEGVDRALAAAPAAFDRLRRTPASHRRATLGRLRTLR